MSSVNEPRVAGRMLDCEIAEKLFGYEWTIMNPRPDDELDRDLKIVRYLSQPGFVASFASWHHKPLLAAKGDEPISDTVPEYIPCYSTDIAAASLVEAEIERRGLGRDYAMELARIVGIDLDESCWQPDLSVILFWSEITALLRATPEQRCRAALSCLPSAPTNQTDGER